MKITFRGTSDALGVPRIYCLCHVCEEARKTGFNRRSRSSITIDINEEQRLWVDCGPDWYEQMEQAQINVVTDMLITHPHFDHIGGLPQWYDQCRYLNIEAKLYAAQEVINEILTRFPWLTGGITFVAIDDGYQFDQWKLHIWRVNHGRNGYSYAFKFIHQSNTKTLVYCPDSINLSQEEQEQLYDVDLLIMGASFLKEQFALETRSVYDVMELIELNRKWNAKQLWITHMSHDINIQVTDHLPAYMNYAKIAQQIELT